MKVFSGHTRWYDVSKKVQIWGCKVNDDLSVIFQTCFIRYRTKVALCEHHVKGKRITKS